jgi:hypothetical protein
MKLTAAAAFALSALSLLMPPATAGEPFSFESVASLDDMAVFIRSTLPLGSPRAALRHRFVEEGHGTLTPKPDDPRVEKYLYDIDLCHYYTWRWNISADFDGDDRLRQAYVNGNIVFPDGNPKRVVPQYPEGGNKMTVLKMVRPRPEAYKGESSLEFILLDRDSDFRTTDDQSLTGSGPSRADPANLGERVVYADVEPWRSIFDFDAAERVVPYRGDCTRVDKTIAASPK